MKVYAVLEQKKRGIKRFPKSGKEPDLVGFISNLEVNIVEERFEMGNCNKCGEEGKTIKTWPYGPKTRKGASFDVSIYECPKGHKWRVYLKKNP